MENKKAIVAIFLIALMIVGMLFVVPMQNNSSVASSHNAAPVVTSTGKTITHVSGSTASPSTGLSRSQMAQKAIELANQSNVPLKDVYLPNFASVSGMNAGHITPGYSQSPAPMGIGFYGLYNKSGSTGTQNYTFPDLAAHINLTQLQTMNLADGSPQGVTFQLNAVLSNVNLFGNSSYSMWTQNVIFYSARTHSLTFILNIWNFSSPAVAWSANSIYQSNYGTLIPYSGAYIVEGPTYQLSNSNLNVNLYLNTSLVGGRQAVNFNYSVANVLVNSTTGAVKTESGMYNQAIFNSSTNAAPLHYLVSGTNLTPTGFIPYDAEIMVGGPGGGSTATIMNISGSMNLMYMNTTTNTFQNVPNAYDIGSETGETSVGVDVHYVGSTAILTGGPSMVYGMWNETNSTFLTYNVTLNHGTNSYVFVGQNATVASEGFWNWAPVNFGKNFVYYLPKSTSYVWKGLSNNYNIANGSLNSTGYTYVNFTSNLTMGVYTPIIIDGNAQVAAVSSSGAGTAASPYIISANAGMLNTIFGQLNDYAFPVFPGFLVYNTNVHMNIEQFSMGVQYTGVGGLIAGFYGLPSTNGMNMWIYNSSNIKVENGLFNSWYSFQQTGYFEGTLTTWNSTNLYIYHNTFAVMSMGAFSYNAPDVKSNISYINNTFYDNALNLGIPLTSSYFYTLMSGSSPIGLMLFSNNTSLHGNMFSAEYPIVSFNYNYYTGFSANYSGDNLNGNYWWNYNGVGPYTNFGGVSTGAEDSTPLILPGANITLNVPSASTQAGVGVSSFYTVTYNGLMVTIAPAYTGNSTVLFDVLAPKAPNYTVFTIESTDYVISTMNSAAGTAVEDSFLSSTFVNTSAGQNLNFNLFTGNMTVYNTNPDGASWAPVLNGVVQASTTASYETVSNIPYGVYFVGENANGLTTSLTYLTILESAGTFASVTTYTLTFTETGLASGTSWSVNVGGNVFSSTTSTISINVPANTYSYSVTPPSGYTVANGSGSTTVSSNTTISVAFTQTNYTLTFTETGLASGTSWNVTVNGHPYTSNTSTLTVTVPYGSVTYSVGSVSGYTTGSGNSTIFVSGNGQIKVTYTTVSVTPSPIPDVAASAAVSAVVGILVGVFALAPLMRKKQ